MTIDDLHRWTATEKHQAAPLERLKLAALLGRGFLAKAPAAPASRYSMRLYVAPMGKRHCIRKVAR